ncbi:MAG TPA: VOC family protein [Quisquiliibacterium sp.]|nr:VOC family protein [Quisquiliibacterium sp.]
MIGYTTLGTNDLARAAAFYDKIAAALGGKRVFENERGIGWSAGRAPMLSVMRPYDGKPASVGNGTMVALVTDSREKVDAVYKLALELGGQDEGAAGPRGERFYGGYFRDLDGNKLVVFCMG